VTAMLNHPQLSLLIDEDEEDCLHFLSKLDVVEFDDIKSGFRIMLHFDENPFFENDVIVKEIRMNTTGEDPKSTSSDIRWKENMNISSKQSEVNKLPRKRFLERRTFFSWWNDHSDPSSDDIAENIKDDLWPNPLQFYLMPDDMGDDNPEEEASDEDEEDDSNLEEEEEEDDDGGEVKFDPVSMGKKNSEKGLKNGLERPKEAKEEDEGNGAEPCGGPAEKL